MKYKTNSLNCLADIQTGPFGSQLHNEDYVLEGTPIVTVEHLGEKNFKQQNLPYVSDADKERLSKYVLKPGDIVFSRVGSVDRCSYVSDKYDGWLFSGRCLRVRPNEALDPQYLYYYFCAEETKQFVRNIAVGATMPSINTALLGQVQISYPDIITQKKIAAILSALDEKIAINRAINDNLQQQASSMFAEWLSTCADASTIGDMSYNILDYSPVCSKQIRLLNSSDITEGVFPIAPLVPNKDLKGHFKKRFQFGDILYSEIRPRNHHYGFVLFDASDYIASTRLMVIRAIENKVSPAMLYQYLLLPEVEAEFTLKTESRSGTFPQGNYADMASIRVPYSPTDSQVAISETLTQIRYTIAQNQLESQRLAELRDTLLPKLISGEIDVSAVKL